MSAPSVVNPLERNVVINPRHRNFDIPIWEHKICRSTPILCDGDGLIDK